MQTRLEERKSCKLADIGGGAGDPLKNIRFAEGGFCDEGGLVSREGGRTLKPQAASVMFLLEAQKRQVSNMYLLWEIFRVVAPLGYCRSVLLSSSVLRQQVTK